MLEHQCMRRVMAILLLAATLAVSGCAHKKPKFVPNSAPNAEAGAQGSGANAANANAGADEETAGPQGGLLATRLIYFDFDSSEIKGQGTDVVAAHAKYLASNSGARVRLEGHTDERGSREYNIGLGERRAQAVRRALLLQGANDAQISTVSYGEERPAAPGHDEAAWAKNRRVEIVYLTPGTGAPAPPPKR
jgi:peptidoglycan-associated lipoprotein